MYKGGRHYVLFICLCLPFIAHASLTELYTVTRHVNLSGQSAQKAKSQALQTEGKQAWHDLLKRLLLAKDQQTIKNRVDATYTHYIESINIRNEKSAHTRYVADLYFQFNEEKIKALFKEMHVTPSERIGPKLLILPLYRNQNSFSLWEETNHWLTVWQNTTPDATLIQFIVPMGDLEDQQLLPLEKALIGNATALQNLVNRYDADDIAFVLVEETAAAPITGDTETVHTPAHKSYKVLVYPNVLKDQQHMYAETLAVTTPSEDIAQNLIHIQQQLVDHVIEDWKQKNITAEKTKSTITETYALPSLERQLCFIELLSQAEQIEKIDILSQTRQKITLEIFFQGPYNQVKRTINKILSET